MNEKPPLRRVAKAVRDLNKHYDGPGPITLAADDATHWGVGATDGHGMCDYRFHSEHSEEIPGDDQPCDCTAIARRLIAGLP